MYSDRLLFSKETEISTNKECTKEEIGLINAIYAQRFVDVIDSFFYV